jgi:hypothetical protein
VEWGGRIARIMPYLSHWSMKRMLRCDPWPSTTSNRLRLAAFSRVQRWNRSSHWRPSSSFVHPFGEVVKHALCLSWSKSSSHESWRSPDSPW